MAKFESHRLALRVSGPPRRVLLITVAGLTATDFLNARGHAVAREDDALMPNLARLAREGAIGVRAQPPSPGSTYAAHASLATGLLPKRHGVIADQALDKEGKRTLPFWDNRLLRGTSLWDAAIGRGVVSLGWPTTTGARIELVVPDAVPSSGSGESWLAFLENRASPFLLKELKSIADEVFLGVKNIPIGKRRKPATWPTPAERDAAFAELTCRIVASERDPGLWLIRFNQTASDHLRFGFGSVEVAEALERVDSEIGRIEDCLSAAGQLRDTAIFVTGDVVYQGVHTRIDPNVALVRNGLIGRDPRSPMGVRSWLALSRSSGRSAYVYARDANDALKAREILEAEAERTGAFEVVPAAELARTGADPQAWFGLAAKPGFVIGNGLAKPAMRPSDVRGSAGAFPFRDPDNLSVGVVAWGRGIRRQVRVPQLDLTDIAPTIAALLGLRLDTPLDGGVLVGILRAAVPAPPPGPKRLGVGNDGDVDRALRELGGGGELGESR